MNGSEKVLKNINFLVQSLKSALLYWKNQSKSFANYSPFFSGTLDDIVRTQRLLNCVYVGGTQKKRT